MGQHRLTGINLKKTTKKKKNRTELHTFYFYLVFLFLYLQMLHLIYEHTFESEWSSR